MEEIPEGFVQAHTNRNISEIDEFRDNRNKQYASLGLSLLLLVFAIVLHEGIGYTVSGVPLGDLVLYALPAVAISIGIHYYRKAKHADATYYDATVYEAAKAIECYENGNMNSAFVHLEKFEDEVTYSQNDVLSDNLTDSASEYYKRAKDSPERQEFLEGTFMELMNPVIDQLDQSGRLKELTEGKDEATNSQDTREYDKYTLATALVLVAVIGTYVVEQTTNFAMPIEANAILLIGALLLSAISIMNS